MVSVSELLARLDLVNRVSHGWMARCPCHNDRTPSLSIREVYGYPRGHCFGCGARTRDVFLVLGLPWNGPAEPPTPFALALSIGRGQAHRRAAPLSEADELRALITSIRADATRMGDCEESWDLLEEAAAHERVLWNMTA